MNTKIYINRKMISKLNLETENLASKNKNIDNNFSTVIQQQLQSISMQMQEFGREMKEMKNEMRSDGKAKDENRMRIMITN